MGNDPRPQEGQTMTYAQVQELLAAQADSFKEVMRELKAPDPEVAAEKAAERARKDAARQRRVAEIKAEEEGRAALQAMCGHKKENGHSAINGQIHSDGLYHPICIHCFKAFEPIKPTPDMGVGGVY